VTELWKPVPAIPGLEASSEGRLRRVRCQRRPVPEPRVLAGHVNACGYRQYSFLMDDGKRMLFLGHRLVCSAFHGLPPTSYHQCAHGDANRLNNRPDNLRWATHAENIEDRNRHGNTPAGETHPMTKASAIEVEIIRRMYAGGFEQREIGRAFRLNQGQVWRICWNKSWSTLKPTPITLAALRRKNPKAWASVEPLDQAGARRVLSSQNPRWAAANAVAKMEAA